MSVTIRLPLPDAKLHAHAKGKWQSKSKPTKALRQLAYMVALQQKPPEPWERATIEYRFFWPDNRRRDAANALHSMKAAVDGIVDAGLIVDDCWQVLQIAGVKCFVEKSDPRTELVFTRVE